MKRMVIRAILGAVVGVVAGYFLFGEVAGVRLSVTDLIPSGSASGIGGALRNAAGRIAGIDQIRQNILLSGAAGAGLGLVTTAVKKR